MTADALSHIPAPTIFPAVGYRDPDAAIEFRDYRARDPEGNIWLFGTYRPGAED